MKLINKSAVVAEITKIYDRNRSNGYIDVCDEIDDILSFIDAIEEKEVDLEKEIKNYFDNQPIITKSKGVDYKLIPSAEKIAKHFFELGLNTNKSLTWEDVKTIQNISGEVYAEVAKGKDDFYLIYPTEQSFLEEVLKRFKSQKGEKV